MKILYIALALLVAGLVLFGLVGNRTEIDVDEISIFGDDTPMSGEIISGAEETGDIFGGDAAAQGNLFGDLGST